MDKLKAFGCDVGRGWPIGRTGPAADFIAAYAASKDDGAEKQKRRPVRAASA